MAAMAIHRSLCSSPSSHFSLRNRSFFSLLLPSLLAPPTPPLAPSLRVNILSHSPSFAHFHYLRHPQQPPLHRLFCSGAAEKKRVNSKLVNFSLSDSESDSEEERNTGGRAEKGIDKTKLPPPYDPFKKKPAIEEPEDPTDLQLIFHKMRSEGLHNSAVKMFDGLSKDGRTHEALELFREIKDGGHMPDVVAYTAVIEAYANAGGGQSKEALKVFLRMLAAGVAPNAYTYSVLIKGLAKDRKLVEVKKYVMEMIGKGMMPNAGTYTTVFEAFAGEEKVEEARELLMQMKDKGFVPNERGVREVLSNKRGQVFRTVINILFNK